VDAGTWRFKYQNGWINHFTLEERLDPKSSSRGIRGTLRIHKAAFDAYDDIVVEADLRCPSGTMAKGVNFRSSSQSLIIENAYDKPDLSSCVLDISLAVKSGLKLEYFTADLLHLGIVLDTGTELEVREDLTLHTTSGAIVSKMDEDCVLAQRWNVATSSGGISGGWSQLEFLSLKSSSGTINVQPWPKEQPTQPYMSALAVVASSGSIKVEYPIDHPTLPDRDYLVDVHSTSGAISGSYLLGSTMNLKTSSGSINAKVLPRHATSKMALVTESTSGSVNVEVLSAQDNSTAPMLDLTSRHVTSSGSTKLVYPQQWEGFTTVETHSGSLNIHGRDLVTDTSSSRSFRGHKGHGHGALSIESTSGSVNLVVGYQNR
jgi:DUF4097 and DUF4098 domain-containing protein YvlB